MALLMATWLGLEAMVRHVEDVVGVPELHQRVFLSELNLGGGAAHQAGKDGLALVNGLSAAVDDAPFDEGEDAGRRHLGVPAEVFLIVEDAQARKVDARGADADLNGISVMDEAVDVFGNLENWLGGRDPARPSGPAADLGDVGAHQSGDGLLALHVRHQRGDPLEFRLDLAVREGVEELLSCFDG